MSKHLWFSMIGIACMIVSFLSVGIIRPRSRPIRRIILFLVLAGTFAFIGANFYQIFKYHGGGATFTVLGLVTMVFGLLLYWAGKEDWLTHAGVGLLYLGAIIVAGTCAITTAF